MSNETMNGAAIDIADFDTSRTEAILEVRHPGTQEVLKHPDGRPMTITVLSRFSDEFESVMRKQNDRRAAIMMRTRQPQTSASVFADETELLVAVTRKWDILFGGEVLPSDPEQYRKVYGDLRFRWLRQQVDDFVGNPANFIKS